MSQAAADTLVAEADALLRSDAFSEAATCYEKAAALAPMHGAAWRGLGHALLRLHRPREAAIAFDRALGLLPDSATALWGATVAHAEIGNAVVAHSYLKRTLALQPTWIEMARAIPQLAVFLQPSARASDALRAHLGAFSARSYSHARDPSRTVEVGRIPRLPEPRKRTYVTIGMSNATWPDPQRPRGELILASNLDDDAECGAILSNLAFHLPDTGFFPEPGVLVRGVIGALALGDLSRRLPHVYVAVPRLWDLPSPLDAGPPAIVLSQVIPVSDTEAEAWQADPVGFELSLVARGTDVTDLLRAGT